MGFLKYLFFTAITVVLVTFCVVNRAIISIDLFPLSYSVEIPIFIFALLCVVSGIILSSIIINLKLLKAKSALKTMQRSINALENENKVLRSESEFVVQTTALKVNSR
ncbi:MAG: lipopolysaccharide assembly protein LapA domain-containing protein [Rickettsiales bacterium]